MAVIYFSIILGKTSEAQLMSIFLVGITFLVFNNLFLRITCVIVTLIGLLAMELNFYYDIIQPLAIPHEKQLLIRWIAYPTVVFLNILVILSYERNIRKLKLIPILEEANIAKTRFVQEISHEIRTPINAIFSIAQSLEQDAEKDERIQNDAVHHLLTACHNVEKIINEVLEIATIESGKLKIELNPLNLRETLSNVLKTCQPIASLKSVKIKLVMEDLPPLIMADATKLMQVITNLVSNATKFTNPNSTVTITASIINGQYKLAIQDEGKGIAADKMKTIFEPFMSEKSDILKGTGLGLTIVKRLVESMNGSINVTNNLGKGACFTVTMPLMPLETGVIIKELKPETKKFDHTTVLVVEDDKMSRLYLTKYLSSLQINVLTADTGEDAIKMAKEHKPDLILTDLQLSPTFSGIDLLNQLQTDLSLKNIPVLVISGDVFKEVADRAFNAGAKEFITKPFSFISLNAALTKYLSHKISIQDTTSFFSFN
jgi:signal transduction histidine kinase/ActR/RegA family two-component response regulator